jgi:basic membrane protein A and related proteins
MAMVRKSWWTVCAMVIGVAVLVSACSAPAAAPASQESAASEGGAQEQPAPNPADQTDDPNEEDVQVPDIEEGKFNVAFIYVGPIGDGGWTYAHNQGRKYVEEQMGDTVHTVYLESVPEGADAERVIRGLARKGFNAIFTTSFGYMDATAAVAEEFPDVYFVHVSGFKKNETNFANLFGAMESMKYLVGMIAGARAQADGNNRIGYVAPFPIPEVIPCQRCCAGYAQNLR